MDLRALILVLAVLGCNSKPLRIVRGRKEGVPPSTRPSERIFAGGVLPPAGALGNPLRENAQTAAEGAKLFTGMNCDGCHGAGAVGQVGPSLTARRWRYGGTDAEIFQSIFYGRPRGMPAFGGALPPDMIWKIVTYIKSLPPPGDVPTESWQEVPGNR